MSDLFEEQIQALRARSQHRGVREIGSAQGAEVAIVGQTLFNFSSDDYLGLANDPRLREAARDAIDEFGIGAGASRLISGTQSPHVRLETALAKWMGTPAALAFSSGYAAAIGVIPAIVRKDDVVLLDRLSHPSLIDGAKLSGATLRVFPHSHLGKLESILESTRRERPDARVLILTEAVSATEGTRAPLKELIELKKRFGALLLLDEAHAIGVIGDHGRGLAAEGNLKNEVEVRLGSLGKALGVSGGYVCGSRSLIEWLWNRARSFVFSTALPPAMAAAANAAVDFLDSAAGEERRQLLWERIRTLREVLPEGRRPVPNEGSAIHPWVIGDELAARDLSRALRVENFLVPAIRYPAVAKGCACLRISVTADHSGDQIRALGQALARLAG